MRFRAEIRDLQCLLAPLQCFSACGPYCLVVLSPATVRLMMTPDVAQTSGEQVYAEMPTTSVFESCRIESQSNNEIPFLLYIPSIVKLLKGCEKASSVVLRLSKREKRAYLTVESKSNDNRVLQDLPIQIQSARKIEDCEEPFLDEPRVKTRMPNLKLLAQVIDKMKTVAEHVEVRQQSNGVCTFTVEQNMIHISTEFEHLYPPTVVATPNIQAVAPSPLANQLIADEIARGVAPMEDVQPAGGGGAAPSPAVVGSSHGGVGAAISPSALHSAMDDSQSVPLVHTSAKVSIKKFANMLQCKTIPAADTLGCIIDNAAFVLHLKLEKKRGTITYYLPLINE